MKLLILFLLLISCAKQKNALLAPPVDVNQDAVTWRDERRVYDETIDVMVAFLWPRDITTDEQRTSVALVIGSSRKLKPLKAAYLGNRSRLRQDFERLDCDCALNGVCEEGDSDVAVDECSEVEEQLSQNNNLLAEFYRLVEVIKTNVRASGGEWLATNLDYPLLPSSRFNVQESALRLEAFGDYAAGGERAPHAYSLPQPVTTRAGVRPRLTWTFPRLRTSETGETTEQGVWTIDVVVSEEDQSVVFQGDLFWDIDGARLRGVIQWEQLKRP